MCLLEDLLGLRSKVGIVVLNLYSVCNFCNTPRKKLLLEGYSHVGIDGLHDIVSVEETRLNRLCEQITVVVLEHGRLTGISLWEIIRKSRLGKLVSVIAISQIHLIRPGLFLIHDGFRIADLWIVTTGIINLEVLHNVRGRLWPPGIAIFKLLHHSGVDIVLGNVPGKVQVVVC